MQAGWLWRIACKLFTFVIPQPLGGLFSLCLVVLYVLKAHWQSFFHSCFEESLSSSLGIIFQGLTQVGRHQGGAEPVAVAGTDLGHIFSAGSVWCFMGLQWDACWWLHYCLFPDAIVYFPRAGERERCFQKGKWLGTSETSWHSGVVTTNVTNLLISNTLSWEYWHSVRGKAPTIMTHSLSPAVDQVYKLQFWCHFLTCLTYTVANFTFLFVQFQSEVKTWSPLPVIKSVQFHTASCLKFSFMPIGLLQ